MNTRKHTNKGVVALCLLPAASAGYAQSDKSADGKENHKEVQKEIKKEIEAGYARSAKAMQQKDTRPMFAQMTPDAVFKEADGRVVPRAQIEAMMKQMFTMMTYSEITARVTRWTWQNKAALLDVTTRSAGTLKTPDGRAHAVTYVSKSRDTWVKQTVGWRLKQIEAVSEAMTQDGKPVVMPPPPAKK